MIIGATSSNHIHRAFTGRCAILLKPGLNFTECAVSRPLPLAMAIIMDTEAHESGAESGATAAGKNKY